MCTQPFNKFLLRVLFATGFPACWKTHHHRKPTKKTFENPKNNIGKGSTLRYHNDRANGYTYFIYIPIESRNKDREIYTSAVCRFIFWVLEGPGTLRITPVPGSPGIDSANYPSGVFRECRLLIGMCPRCKIVTAVYICTVCFRIGIY